MTQEDLGPVKVKYVTETMPRRRREYVTTDGQGFRSAQAAKLHQGTLDWRLTDVELQPMRLDQLAALVQKMLEQYGPEAVLGYDAGYNNVGFSVALPQRSGAKPEDIRW